jgi:fluoroquinolone transport system permease protein
MSRLGSSLQNNIVIQVRKNYYTITLVVALLVAVVSSLLFEPENFRLIIPAIMLLIVGGTTFVFIGGLIFDEREKGVLQAMIVSPLKVGEYLWAKILSLTILSTIEIGIMIFGPLFWFQSQHGISIPNPALLLSGIIILNLIYTLMGLCLAVYFKRMTDFMLPLTAVIIFLQFPIVYFFGIIPSSWILIVPSAAPVMLIQAAFIDLSQGLWIYTFVYIFIQLGFLIFWSHRAFTQQIVKRLV